MIIWIIFKMFPTSYCSQNFHFTISCDERLWKFQNNLHGNSSIMWLGVNVLGIKSFLGIVSKKEYMFGRYL
jgi:hypothetical protein